MSKTKERSKRSMKIPSYNFYYEKRRYQVYKDVCPVDFYEFDGKCKLEWKAMSANEKAPFRKRSMDYYQEALESIKQNRRWTGAPVDAGKAKKDAKKKKRAKDPNAPKRPMSALRRFSNDQRARLLEKHPGTRAADISIILGQKWNLADCQTKKRYNQLAEKDQQRYKLEMAEYKKKATASTGAPLAQSSKEGQESKRNSDEEVSKVDSDDKESETDSDDEDSDMDSDEDDSEMDTDEEEPKMGSDEKDAE